MLFYYLAVKDHCMRTLTIEVENDSELSAILEVGNKMHLKTIVYEHTVFDRVKELLRKKNQFEITHGSDLNSYKEKIFSNRHHSWKEDQTIMEWEEVETLLTEYKHVS